MSRSWVSVPLVLALTACGSSDTPRAAVASASAVVLAAGHGLAWSPDGRSVVTAESAGSGPSPEAWCPSPQPRFALRLHSVGKADTGRLLSGDPRLYEPVAARVSPDGRQVAVLGYGDEEFIGSVAIVSMTGALRTRVLASSREKSYGTPYGRGTLGWLSASELLVYRTTYTGTGGPGEFVREALVVDVPTMRTRVLARDVGLESANVVPGKGFLLLTRTGENARVEFLDKDGATRTPVAAGRAAEVAPDGGTAAVWGFTASDDAANTTSLRLVPLPSGTPSRTVDLPPGDLVEVAWSPVSNRLLAVVESSGESDETTRRAFVVRVPGGAVAELALTDYASGGGWSPDGTRLLYTTGSGEVSVVQVP